VIAKVTSGGGFRGVLDYLTQQKKQSQDKTKAAEREHEKELERELQEHQIEAPEKSKIATVREQTSTLSETEKAIEERGHGEHEKALEEGKVERHRLIGGNMTGRSARELAREFEVFWEQRPEIEKPVHHVSLSAARGERLSVEQWNEIAEKYVQRMGFERSPYIVIRHIDTEHDHVHIVTSRVDAHGNIVSDFRSKARAEEFVREIEDAYNLVRVKRSRDTERAAPKRGELEKFDRTGELSTKMKLQGHVDYALKEKATATEFVAKLNRVGVDVIPYFRSAELVTGVSFRLGSQMMKGSDLGRGYSWNGLQKRGLEYDRERDLAVLREAQMRGLRGADESRTVHAPGARRSSNSVEREREIGGGNRLMKEPAAERETIGKLQQLAGIEPGKDGRGMIERLQETAGIVRVERPTEREEHVTDRGLINEQALPQTPELIPAAATKEKAPEKVFELSR